MPEPILGAAAETLLKTLGEGVYLVDPDRRIIFWNAAAERITGFGQAEVIGKRCADNILVHVDETGRQLCTGCCPLAATLNDGQPRRSTVFLNHREGHRVAVQVQTLRLTLEDGSVVGAEIFTETGSREALLEQIGELQRLSLADPLTGLPNRRQMESVIAARSAAMRRNGIPFGVLFVDIDRFKAVNDRFGHIAGDKVLVTVAKTLLSSVRPFDTVGRWGGEEFLGIFPGISPANLQDIAERLRNLVAASHTGCEGHSISVTVSIGATMALPEDDETSVTARADALMYQGKNAGRNRVVQG
jgi:diguanylate cyclase (GGDEF)-like protein/PAS domain S-box-containing protein